MPSSLVATLYIEKIGKNMLHRQSRVVCSGFSYSDGSAEWLIWMRTRWSLIEVERPLSCRGELDEEGFVDTKGEEKEAESSRKV